MPSELWNGQFHLVHGEPRQFGPYGGVFHGPGTPGASPSLHLVVEPLAPAITPALSDLLPGLGAIFERESLSLTGALIRCIGAVHEHLQAWNHKALPAHRSGVAVSGLAIRGDQAYLAHAGPAVSYLRRGDDLRRQLTPPEAATPVGLGPPPQPDFSYFSLREGDLFLLGFSSIERRLDQELLLTLLSARPDRALAGLYEQIQAEEDFAAILVAVDPPEGTPIDLPPLPARHAPQSFAGSAAQGRRLPPRRRDSDDRQFALFPAPAVSDDEPLYTGQPIPVHAAPPNGVERDRPPEPAGVMSREEDEPVAEEAYLEAGGVAERDAGPDGEPASAFPAGEAGERLRRVRQRPRRGAPSPLGALPEPGSGSPFQPAGVEPDLTPKIGLARAPGPSLRRRLTLNLSRRTALLAGALAGIAALAVLAVLLVPGMLGENTEARVRDLVAEAAAIHEAVLRVGSPDLQREGLRAAAARVNEALALNPEDATARELAERLRADLAALNREFELTDLRELAGLERVLSAPGAVDEATILPGRAFLLDRAGAAVVRLDLARSEAPTAVFAEGEELEGAPLAAPEHLAYLVTDGLLLIAAADGTDYLYEPGEDLVPVDIPGRREWDSLDALLWADGRLLAVDLAGGVIHRYTFSKGKFKADGQLPLGPRPPAAVKAATWADHLYLLDAEGSLYRLEEAGLAAVTPGNLDRPLRSPQALAGDPITGELYIADRGNDRIVVLDRDGDLRRQLVSPVLASLGPIAVDAKQRVLYLIAGDVLYSTKLPPPSGEGP